MIPARTVAHVTSASVIGHPFRRPPPNEYHTTHRLWLKTSAILVGVLTACGGGSSGVQWGDYAPGLQALIDAENCTALQAEFDQAEANNAATQARVGHNNAKLMVYINDRIKAAGC